MKAEHLLKLARISSQLEREGMVAESDRVRTALLKLGANWQSPYMDIPLLERKWPFDLVDEDFQEADDLRNKFPRYDEKEDLDLAGEDEVEFDSLEVRLHPHESDPGAGIKFVWPDFASSLQQGSDWGKKMKTHDQNNAANERYKNLVPTFY